MEEVKLQNKVTRTHLEVCSTGIAPTQPQTHVLRVFEKTPIESRYLPFEQLSAVNKYSQRDVATGVGPRVVLET